MLECGVVSGFVGSRIAPGCWFGVVFVGDLMVYVICFILLTIRIGIYLHRGCLIF